MFTVYADNYLIYSPDLVSDGYWIESPVCEKEVNKSGSFTFSIYDSNPHYNHLQVLKTIITIKDDAKEIWRGRVLNYERDFNNRKTVYCEGALSFFVDSVVRPYKYTCNLQERIKKLIDSHNEQVDDFKKFKIGTIDVDDLYGSKEWSSDSYTQTNEEIENLISDYGGYLLLKYDEEEKINTFNYVKNPSQYANQTIEFGQNLLDLKVSINPENVCTVLIPIGANADGETITIAPVNDNKDYIYYPDAVAVYGFIVRSVTFEENVSSPSELLIKARDYLLKNLKEAKTITVSALDLHIVDPSINAIDVYDIIKTTSFPHNVDTYEMCTRVSLNIQNLSQCEYTIGDVPSGIAQILSKQTK